jgi:phage terminase large subunit
MTVAAVERKRGRGRPKQVKLTLLEDFTADLRAELEAISRVRFPSPRYRQDPVAFFREILGVEPWSKQIEVIEAVRDHKRVAVRAGHKVSKSHTIAGLALWYFCSFEDARVVLTSTTARQVDQILWRELRMVRQRGGRCVDCKKEIKRLVDGGMSQVEAEERVPRPCEHSALITEEPSDLARTGLRSADFREISGFTAREPEAVAGISGKNLLYLPDEASGIPDSIFEAIEGNRAGGARLAMFSNPTRNSGEFYEAFASKAHLYHTITISSEDTPNAQSGLIVIPGLAEREWIEEKKAEWGEQSALYKIRIKGEHALHEEGCIFSVHAITQAERAWADTEGSGRLFIGCDPAGPTGSGDDSAFAPRRGLKILEISTRAGLTAEGHLVHLLGLIAAHKLPRETPVVVIDGLGDIGAKLARLLREHLERHKDAFELVVIRASDRAVRQPHIYERMRDELTANFEQWIRDGGAVPTDTRLSKEMHVMEWISRINGKVKVTPKDEIRKALGRSPDRYDAVALACWEPLSLREGVSEELRAKAAAASQDVYDRPALDPYEASKTWR